MSMRGRLLWSAGSLVCDYAHADRRVGVARVRENDHASSGRQIESVELRPDQKNDKYFFPTPQVTLSFVMVQSFDAGLVEDAVVAVAALGGCAWKPTARRPRPAVGMTMEAVLSSGCRSRPMKARGWRAGRGDVQSVAAAAAARSAPSPRGSIGSMRLPRDLADLGAEFGSTRSNARVGAALSAPAPATKST